MNVFLRLGFIKPVALYKIYYIKTCVPYVSDELWVLFSQRFLLIAEYTLNR